MPFLVWFRGFLDYYDRVDLNGVVDAYNAVILHYEGNRKGKRQLIQEILFLLKILKFTTTSIVFVLRLVSQVDTF